MENLLEKIEEVKTELQQVAENHNQLLEQLNVAKHRFTELQGALKTLQQLEESTNGREND